MLLVGARFPWEVAPWTASLVDLTCIEVQHMTHVTGCDPTASSRLWGEAECLVGGSCCVEDKCKEKSAFLHIKRVWSNG